MLECAPHALCIHLTCIHIRTIIAVSIDIIQRAFAVAFIINIQTSTFRCCHSSCAAAWNSTSRTWTDQYQHVRPSLPHAAPNTFRRRIRYTLGYRGEPYERATPHILPYYNTKRESVRKCMSTGTTYKLKLRAYNL